jgi:hypothetical protein
MMYEWIPPYFACNMQQRMQCLHPTDPSLCHRPQSSSTVVAAALIYSKEGALAAHESGEATFRDIHGTYMYSC